MTLYNCQIIDRAHGDRVVHDYVCQHETLDEARAHGERLQKAEPVKSPKARIVSKVEDEGDMIVIDLAKAQIGDVHDVLRGIFGE